MATKKRNTKKGVRITGDGGGYPRLPLKSIEIVERPQEGKEDDVLFFNPRDPANFTPESMAELRFSVRTDELLEPLVVRAQVSGCMYSAIQLLAGERRFRTLLQIVKDNVACFSSLAPVPAKWRAKMVVLHLDNFAQVVKQTGDEVEIALWDEHDKPTGETRTVPAEELSPTLPASKVYATVPCKVIQNCTDGRAMRIAMSENEHSQPLTTAEEIAVVERLLRKKLKQEQIAYMLATNITWVSQTASFRHQLPEEAFEKLVDGTMVRHVAVNFLSYRPGDRQKLFDATVKAEEKDTAEKVRQHQLEMDAAEDEADMLSADAKKAAEAGDDKAAKKAARQAAAAGKKAEVSAGKKAKAESQAGKIKQGHVQKGAVEAGVAPKKAKMLPRGDIETCFVTNVDSLLEGGTSVIDAICEKRVMPELLNVVKATALAILNGKRDAVEVIRTVKVAAGTWSLPETDDDDGEFDPEAYDPDDDDDPDFDPHEDEAYEDTLDLMDRIDDGVLD
jgi:hypothetical protein